MANNDDLPVIVVERRSGGFSSFLWGALLGAGLALLYSPRSGKETRREIADGAHRLKDATQDAVRRAQNAVSGGIEEVREQVNHRVGSARQAMDAGREAARAARTDLERRVHEAAPPRAEPVAHDPSQPLRRGHPYSGADDERDEPRGPATDGPTES